jgi:hypothetical protein
VPCRCKRMLHSASRKFSILEYHLLLVSSCIFLHLCCIREPRRSREGENIASQTSKATAQLQSRAISRHVLYCCSTLFRNGASGGDLSPSLMVFSLVETIFTHHPGKRLGQCASRPSCSTLHSSPKQYHIAIVDIDHQVRCSLCLASRGKGILLRSVLSSCLLQLPSQLPLHHYSSTLPSCSLPRFPTSHHTLVHLAFQAFSAPGTTRLPIKHLKHQASYVVRPGTLTAAPLQPQLSVALPILDTDIRDTFCLVISQVWTWASLNLHKLRLDAFRLWACFALAAQSHIAH